MTGTLRWILTRVIPPTLLVLVPGVLLGQGPAVITGRVLDESERPIASATVAIPALGLTATTRATGEYTIIVPGARVQGQTPVLEEGSRDHRVEGTVIGALLLGALGYWVGHEACTHQRQPTGPNGRDCGSDGLVVGLVGGVVGAGVGYVVGRSTRR